MSAWEQVLVDLSRRDIYVASALLAALLVLSWLLYFLLKRVVKRLVDRSGTNLDNMALASVEKPLFIALGLLGLYLALLALPFIAAADVLISRLFQAAFVVLGIYTGVRLVDTVLKWYILEVAAKTKTTLDDTLVPVLRIGVPAIAGFLGIVLLLGIFGFPVESVEGWLAEHGSRLGLIVALSVAALLGLGSGVGKMVRIGLGQGKAGETKEEVKKRADTLTGVLVTSGQVLVITIAAFMILSEVGVNIAPVLAGAGIAGVAIGFGAQSLIRDIIAGIFIVSDNQYRVGDVVKIADIAGLVEEINLKRTVLRDLDGAVHFVPNGEIKVASNFTRGYSRVNLDISVGYGEDLDRVIAVMNRVGNEMASDPVWAPFIIKAPQVLRVNKLGDSGIDIKMVGDTQPMKQWDVMGELRLRLKRTFDKEGIEIPWPHTKVYFGNSPSSSDSKKTKSP